MIDTENNEEMFQWMAKRYGYGYEKVNVVYVINAGDGTAILTRTVDVFATTQVTYLDTLARSQSTSKSLPSANLTAHTAQIHDSDEPTLPSARSLTPGTSVFIEDEKEEANSATTHTSSSLLRVAPSLKVGQRCTYELVQKQGSAQKPPLHSVFGTMAELKSARERAPLFDYDEHFGWHVNRPTRSLSMTVVFPYGWAFKVHDFTVLFAQISSFPSTQQQRNERELVDFRSGFMSQSELTRYDGRFFLQLKMEYPMIGLIYAIHWSPVQRGMSHNQDLEGSHGVQQTNRAKGDIEVTDFMVDPNIALAASSAIQLASWFLVPGAAKLSEAVGAAFGDQLSRKIRQFFSRSDATSIAADLADDESRRALQADIEVMLLNQPGSADLILIETRRGLTRLLSNRNVISTGELQDMWRDFGDPQVGWDDLLATYKTGRLQSSIAEKLVDEAIRSKKLPDLIQAVQEKTEN